MIIRAIRATAHSGGYGLGVGPDTRPQEHWSAAVRTDLREKFGFAEKSYQWTYALVETANKRLIVKIDLSGLSARSRHRPQRPRDALFRSTLELGLIKRVKVTPLVGNDMTPGPVENDLPTNFAGWLV